MCSSIVVLATLRRRGGICNRVEIEIPIVVEPRARALPIHHPSDSKNAWHGALRNSLTHKLRRSLARTDAFPTLGCRIPGFRKFAGSLLHYGDTTVHSKAKKELCQSTPILIH